MAKQFDVFVDGLNFDCALSVVTFHLEATVQGQSCTMPETPTSRKNEIAAKKAIFWGRKIRKPYR